MTANPLFPSSKSTGVSKAYEQAAFMDDTEEMNCHPNDSQNKHLDPEQIATTRNVSTTEVTKTVFGVFFGTLAVPIVFLFNPVLGVVYLIAFACLISGKKK